MVGPRQATHLVQSFMDHLAFETFECKFSIPAVVDTGQASSDSVETNLLFTLPQFCLSVEENPQVSSSCRFSQGTKTLASLLSLL